MILLVSLFPDTIFLQKDPIKGMGFPIELQTNPFLLLLKLYPILFCNFLPILIVPGLMVANKKKIFIHYKKKKSLSCEDF